MAEAGENLIHDWNSVARQGRPAPQVTFFDETLRDGIQNPSVCDPKIEDKLELLHLMDELGIQYVDVGLPGAGRRAAEDVARLVRETADGKMRIRPAVACRTVVADIAPAVDVAQKTGVSIEVMAFIGSSPIRQYAEEWTVDLIAKRSADAIDFAVKNGLPCCFVTEDTTRSSPDQLEVLFKNAIDHGAHRLCLCDTVGHATPEGARALVLWTRDLVSRLGAKVGIDWHGHNDRGLGVVNTMAAAEAGADRVHGCALGIGERVGNAAMELLLLNFRLDGGIDQDLTKLVHYCEVASRAVRFPIPVSYPLVGRDAFRTATGVHAAAIVKAEAKGEAWLADRVYSGVPAGLFGRGQEIEIGHMSGASNVTYWLKKRKIEATPERIEKILAHAKQSDHVLTEEEVFALLR